MAVMTASDLSKDIAGRPLLRGVSFKLERRERMTLAGRNGAGKTTLLRMLAGEASIDGGELSVAKGARIALHDQRPPRERRLTLHDYVLSGCAEELAIEAELAALESQMAHGASDDALLARYSRAQARLEVRGGYLWRERALSMAHGLGFSDDDAARELGTFSGGQLTRASLARALARHADVLLLDEPTNHLDIESLEWLEQTLADLDAAIVLVAHDRWFLEAVGTAVLELDRGRARYFKGSWHQWRKEQAARELALGRAVDAQRAEIERMERFIERFRYKATKARQAQSRVKKLAKMERVELEPAASKGLEFSFKAPERSGRVIFELLDGRIEVGDHIVLLEHVELWLERGEHVSLVGSNGSGKTTLIETLAGKKELAAGKLRVGHNVKVGYLSQHADELGGEGPAGAAQSVLDATQRATGLTPGKARALLARFLFSGEEAEKPVAGLSGGERRRVSLAILVHGGANVLILDEPTNHLDISSREALEDALSAFPGAVLLVTHDRALLDAVGSRTLAVEDRTLHSYLGGWAEFVRVRDERREAGAGARAGAAQAGVLSGRRPPNTSRLASASDDQEASDDREASEDQEASEDREAREDREAGVNAGADGSANGGAARARVRARAGARGQDPFGHRPTGAAARSAAGDPAAKKERPKREGPSKNRLAAIARAERAVEDAEAAMRTLEDELADPAAWATPYESAKSEARHTAARRAVESAFAELEALSE